jgi:hypothetical protein
MARRCRPTLRLLVDDLQLKIPAPETALDYLEHPILNKAHGFARSLPKNQRRIEAIKDTLVYRFTHGRSRVATWQHENGPWPLGSLPITRIEPPA